MKALLIQNMAPMMFGSLVAVLLLGYPAAFSLAFVGLFYALVGIELGQFQPDFLQALPDRLYGVPHARPHAAAHGDGGLFVHGDGFSVWRISLAALAAGCLFSSGAIWASSPCSRKRTPG